jgi:hypothetical protein
MRSGSIRSLLVLCISMMIGRTAIAQNAHREYVDQDGWSIGMNVGLSDLWGDVGTKSFITHYTNSKYFDKVAFIGGMFGRYSIHPCLAVRFTMNYGTLYATDKWNYDAATTATSQGQDAYQRYARAQNAKDNIFEGSIMFELNPMRLNPESKGASKRGQVYLMLGIGYMHFSPYSTVGDGGTWVNTYNLHLEGQGWGDPYPKQYHLWQPVIPLGIGYRWDLGQHLNLGFEYQYRYTFTDYLDGVSGKYVGSAAYAGHMSEHDALLAANVADKGYYMGLSGPNAAGNMRGNPSNKDSYSTISITLFYKVPTRTRRWW